MTSPAKPAENAPEFDFATIVPTAATALPKQQKPGKDNPLAATVKASIDDGYKPFSYGPIPDAIAGKAKNLMHRAARELGVGLAVRVTSHGNGTTTLVYQAKQEKKERKYTNDQVRGWVAAEMAKGVAFPGYDAGKRLTADVLKRFRDANGMNKPEEAKTEAASAAPKPSAKPSAK